MLVLGGVLFSTEALDGIIHLTVLNDIQIAVLDDVGVGHLVLESDPDRGVTHDLSAEAINAPISLQMMRKASLRAIEDRTLVRQKSEDARFRPAYIQNHMSILVMHTAARSVGHKKLFQLDAVHLTKAVRIDCR